MQFKNGSQQQNQISNGDIFYANFKKDGSRNLNINGSVTPSVFTLEDLTVDKIILSRVEFLISCGSSIDLNSFGSRAILVNGVEFNIDGVQAFFDNGDIMLFASEAGTETGKVEGVETAFINGHWNITNTFQNGLICNVSDLTITIQDDLSEIGFFKIAAEGLKIS